MGNKCCGASAPTDGGDLPAVSLMGIKDSVKKFEMGFPFHRMEVQKWSQMVHEIGEE